MDPAAQGSIAGQTQWPGVTPAEHKVPLRVSMLGTEDETRGAYGAPSILLGERFEFKDVPEGPVPASSGSMTTGSSGISASRSRAASRPTSPGVRADSSVPANTFPLQLAESRVARRYRFRLSAPPPIIADATVATSSTSTYS